MTTETKLKTLIGTVSSVSMQKTAVVSVDRYEKHPRYGKFIRSRKNYKVDDAEKVCKLGDRVEIISCRPVSKDKCFRFLRKIEETTAAPSVSAESNS